MKKFRFTLNVLAIACLTLAFASVANAQASRTWVSGVGDDANPCSRTAPCKTFAGAISKTATNGEIDALDDAGFGAVTITKSITIDGGGHTASVLAALTTGVIINAPTSADVTLRNLTINGIGTGFIGVRIMAAKSVHIDRCVIFGFRQTGGNNGRGVSDERNVSQSPAPQLFVTDTKLRDNVAGIGVSGASPQSIRAFIDHCRIQNNNTFGVLSANSAFVHIVDSDISGNLGEGVRVETNAQANIMTCLVDGNLTGVLNSGGSQVLLGDSNLFNNATGVSGTVTTFGNNNVRNNGGGNTLPASVGQQ